MTDVALPLLPALGRPTLDQTLQRAGVRVLELRTPAETERAADLLGEVWRNSEPPVPANLLRTVQHIGGYVFGAYDDSGAMLGTSLGLLSDGGLHSHITGVVAAGQRRGLGYVLKQHQRLWALERGITTVTWTCDPLVRRNMAFNLHALGATVTAYLPDHYGSMRDGVNRGDETDRVEVRWDLLSEPAVGCLGARRPFVAARDLPWAVTSDGRGRPVVDHTRHLACLVQLPGDIEALRGTDAAAAIAWRHAVREVVLPVVSEGGRVLGLTSAGALVLEAAA